MKTKLLILVLLILITIIAVKINSTLKSTKEYDNMISGLNTEIIQLQKQESEYAELIEQKNQLVSDTKNEILNSKKGSTLTDLEEEKNQLINKINKSI